MASTTNADPIARRLAQRPHLVLDGALGTELARRGADMSDPLWSARLLVDDPDLIRAVHLDYFRAGADVATTATYQATFEGFARRGIDAAQAAALMRRAVALACEAREQYVAEARPALRPLVAASVGPYGAMLADGAEYRGNYGLDEAALMAFHRPRLQVLATAGADLLACETLPCLAEARALARLLEELPGTFAWVAFSCRDGAHDCQGEPFAECVAALDGYAQVAAIGINCTAPHFVGELVAIAAAHTRKPVVVYPNSGEQWDGQRKDWRGVDECATRPLDEQAMDWAAAGARLIGGCCRTTPAHIAALARRWSDR